MSLTDKHLILSRPHPGGLGGEQRLYRFPSGYGISAVNSAMLHSHPFAWECAVLERVAEDGSTFSLTYDTPLTSDVEVFDSDEEANAFIERAAAELGSLSRAEAILARGGE